MSTSDVLLSLAEALSAERDKVRAELHALPHWEDALWGIAHEEWPSEPWVAAHLDGQTEGIEKAHRMVMKLYDECMYREANSK
jgi:hypothetical protein